MLVHVRLAVGLLEDSAEFPGGGWPDPDPDYDSALSR